MTKGKVAGRERTPVMPPRRPPAQAPAHRLRAKARLPTSVHSARKSSPQLTMPSSSCTLEAFCAVTFLALLLREGLHWKLPLACRADAPAL